MKRSLTSFIATCLMIALCAPVHAGLTQREDVQGFIQQMVKTHKFSRNDLESLFREARIREDILQAMARPAEAKPWHDYRPIFLTQDRIEGGVKFWRDNQAALAKAEAEFGVPAHVIVAIVGVETRYGRHVGNYRVIDALSTLAFDYPPRSRFFTGQLEEFLLMAREEKIDPLALLGSYAGAMGQPQFIPSSFRAYAVDFDGDGKRDLWNNTTDIIGSVANYFRRHGWQYGKEVVHSARVQGSGHQALLEKGLKPATDAAHLRSYGVLPANALTPTEPVALVRLDGSKGPEYWVTQKNFYVITRYNRSPLYAMAVHQLSEAIRTARAG